MKKLIVLVAFLAVALITINADALFVDEEIPWIQREGHGEVNLIPGMYEGKRWNLQVNTDFDPAVDSVEACVVNFEAMSRVEGGSGGPEDYGCFLNVYGPYNSAPSITNEFSLPVDGVWRSYRALVYVNDDVSDGDFWIRFHYNGGFSPVGDPAAFANLRNVTAEVNTPETMAMLTLLFTSIGFIVKKLKK